MPDDTSMGGANVRFQTTLWSVVRDARDGSREGLDRLLALYWKPVYFFIRRRGHDVESAKDLTQSFFAVLMEREFLGRVTPDRGRFRSFLLASLVHFLSDEYDRARAAKRGGDYDFVAAEADLASAEPAPDEAYNRQWAREIVSRAMERLRSRVSADDMALFSGGGPADLSNEERKYRFRRLRQRLRECIMEELLATVESEREAESEIRDLFAAFA